MPRQPKKADDKKAAVAVAPAPMIPAPTAGVIPQPPIPIGVTQRVVDNESFLRVRDSVSRTSSFTHIYSTFSTCFFYLCTFTLSSPAAAAAAASIASIKGNALVRKGSTSAAYFFKGGQLNH